MKKNNTLLEIERIENELKNNYGVEIVKKQYIPSPWFEMVFSEEKWYQLESFQQSVEKQQFMDDCRIRSVMLARDKYQGRLMGNVPKVDIISHNSMRFYGLLSMLEFFVVLLAKKGMRELVHS